LPTAKFFTTVESTDTRPKSSTCEKVGG
jgi:hypothetical protein